MARVNIAELLPMLAPIAAVGAAWAFFAGDAYDGYLLGFFGLPSGLLNRSIQQTMAVGFQAFLTAFSAPLLLAIVIILSRLAYCRLRKRPFHPELSHEGRAARMRFVVIYMSLFAVASGWLTAFLAAGADYSRTVLRVSGPCETCFLYRTTKGQVVGMPLGQDDKVLILVTRTGVAVLPAGSIKAVRSINERQGLPWWMVFGFGY